MKRFLHLWSCFCDLCILVACVYLCFLSCMRCCQALLLYLFVCLSFSVCPLHRLLLFHPMFQVIKDTKDRVCVCACVCVSDLGLRHDIEVVKIRGESHVSEDGPIVHRLNRLILQRQRGSIYPDLEDRKHHHALYAYYYWGDTYVVSLVLQQITSKTSVKLESITLPEDSM